MNYVRERLADKGLKLILSTVKMDKTTAFAALASDKQLAKIFSSFLDVYYSLPYHLDLEFDAAWRSLENSIGYMLIEPGDIRKTNLFMIYSKELVWKLSSL